jgi:hypothetical protein
MNAKTKLDYTSVLAAGVTGPHDTKDCGILSCMSISLQCKCRAHNLSRL